MMNNQISALQQDHQKALDKFWQAEYADWEHFTLLSRLLCARSAKFRAKYEAALELAYAASMTEAHSDMSFAIQIIRNEIPVTEVARVLALKEYEHD